jgi:hypothetical protein
VYCLFGRSDAGFDIMTQGRHDPSRKRQRDRIIPPKFERGACQI